MLKLFLKIILSFLLLLSFPQSVIEAAFTFTDAPSNITEDQTFNVNVTIDGLSAGNIYYLRADFAHTDTPTSYFGYTKNNTGSWYNAQPSLDHTQLYLITMQEGNTWSGYVETKLDTGSSKYKGSGNYNFRLRRYTPSGATYYWADTTAQIVVTVAAAPTTTPVPTNTLTPTNTPSPTPTTKPTSTPKPISSSTKTPTPTPIQKPTSVSSSPTSIEPTYEVGPTSVLGESTEGEVKDDDKNSKVTPVENTKVLGIQANNLSKILIGVGLIFLLACGILFLRSYINDKKEKEA